MNLEKNRRLKIQELPNSISPYQTAVVVISISPIIGILENKMNLEIKVEEWVINWN